LSSFKTSQNIIFLESSYKNRHIILPRKPKSLKLLYSINEFKNNILALVGRTNKQVGGRRKENKEEKWNSFHVVDPGTTFKTTN